MKQYIDKSKILEELKRCEKICDNYMLSYKDSISQGIANAKRAMCQHIIKIINTLEVKEVDLEKEKDDYWNKLCNSEFGELLERDAKWFDDIAKHFFELGIKTKKRE